MNCPNCKDTELLPNKIDDALTAMTCNTCHGAIISLEHYIQYQEINGTIKTPEIEMIIAIDDTACALNCPNCSGFMTKYRISNHTNNRLDLCFSCYINPAA